MPRKSREEYNAYMNNYMKERYARRREEAVAALGGKCVSCGTTENLEFDHIDPAGKDFAMARASAFSEKRWQAELAKCQLLCGDCHKAKHATQHPCGTVHRYWAGCKCGPCKGANSKYNADYKNRRKADMGLELSGNANAF